MRIAIGSDHAVTDMKDKVGEYLKNLGHEVIDCGNYTNNSTHYAIYGHAVASLVATAKADLGIVFCGSGVGISNSVNKTKNIRAVLAHNSLVAQRAKELYDANVVSIGGRVTGLYLAIEIVDAFLNAKYLQKNEKEIKKINSLIKNDNFDSNIFDEFIKDWEAGKYTDGKPQAKIDFPGCDLRK